MTEQGIIKQLGAANIGRKLRDRGLKVEDVTVRSWNLPGRTIPAKYWLHIAEIAREAGFPFSVEQFARAAAA